MTTITFTSTVQEHILRVEERMQGQSKDHHPDLDAALRHLLNSGGKRVRPTVTLLVGGMVGADIERAVTLASAVELLHTATLVHDDMIDGALLRRGNPTLNAQWSPAATILTGDFIFARAAKLAAETDSIEVMNMFAKTLSTIVNGEITQIFDSKGLASRENYYDRIYAKTASMFELAASAPIFLSDAGEEAFNTMMVYGYEVGMAFQIVDDVLDFTSEQDKVGKPIASDLRQGLITLPALCYIEGNPEDPNVKHILNGGIKNEDSLNGLIDSIRAGEAVHQAMAEAKQHVQRGLDALEGMPECTERQALEDLANYVVDRDL